MLTKATCQFLMIIACLLPSLSSANCQISANAAFASESYSKNVAGSILAQIEKSQALSSEFDALKSEYEYWNSNLSSGMSAGDAKIDDVVYQLENLKTESLAVQRSANGLWFDAGAYLRSAEANINTAETLFKECNNTLSQFAVDKQLSQAQSDWKPFADQRLSLAKSAALTQTKIVSAKQYLSWAQESATALSNLAISTSSVENTSAELATRIDYIVAKTSEYSVVEVYLSTDRKRNLNREAPAVTVESFANSRGDGSLVYALVQLTVPSDHRMGEVELPKKRMFWFDEEPDESKHITIKHFDVLTAEAFRKKLSLNSMGDGSNALLFVHGYNTSLYEALTRSGQLKYDLAHIGPVVLYSWSSLDKPLDYIADRQTAEWSAEMLKVLLIDILKTPELDKLNILAHSMGARVLHFATSSLDRENLSELEKIDNVILAAPDLDASVFKDKIAPVLLNISKSTTLYASSEDSAIELSRKVNKHRILGDTSEGVFVLENLTSIDATNVKTDISSHSYFGDSDSMISDIYYMLSGIEVGKRSGLIPSTHGDYWEFKLR